MRGEEFERRREGREGGSERAGCNAGVEEVAYNVVIKGDQYADT